MDSSVLLIPIILGIILVLLIVVLFFSVAACLWRKGTRGLHHLASSFPATETPEGATFSRQTVMIDGVRYRNCTKVVIAREGLSLSVSLLVPGISGGSAVIPWERIIASEEEQDGWTRAGRLTVSAEPPVSITLPATVVRAFPETMNGRIAQQD